MSRCHHCRRRPDLLGLPNRPGCAAAGVAGVAAIAAASLVLLQLCARCPTSAALSSPASSSAPILVVGATGGMGPRALAGLMDVGFAPGQLRVVTRREAKAEELRELGFGAAVADLDEAAGAGGSRALDGAVAGCAGCYVHSTSSDTKKLDTAEVERAENLLGALARGGVRSVAFNSAAGEAGHGVERIRQKHDVERVFMESGQEGVSFTSLRANLFMEELWKRYTRPSILKGTFPFSVPSDRPIYLTSVRDMGRLAGTVLLGEQQAAPASQPPRRHRVLNVAGDVLTPEAMADAFARAQGSPCEHSQSRVFALLARLFFRDLYEVIRFYRRSTETTDIDALKREFPGLLTSFDDFLEETHWSDPDLTFEDLQKLRACSGSRNPRK